MEAVVFGVAGADRQTGVPDPPGRGLPAGHPHGPERHHAAACYTGVTYRKETV